MAVENKDRLHVLGQISKGHKSKKTISFTAKQWERLKEIELETGVKPSQIIRLAVHKYTSDFDCIKKP